MDFADFAEDEKTVAAVAYRIINISHQLGRDRGGLAAPELSRRLRLLRNALGHDYEAVRVADLWRAVERLPELRKHVAELEVAPQHTSQDT